MGIREIQLVHDESKSNVRAEFHDDSKPNGVKSMWEAVGGYGGRERYYVNLHEDPITHYKKTGEVPLGYVVKRDEILFEGAVIKTYTEDRQFMSDVYGTAWVAVVWDGKKIVDYTYGDDIGYNNCFSSSVKVDATAEVLEKYNEEIKREREELEKRATKEREERKREAALASLKATKGTVVEIIAGKNKPRKGEPKRYGFIHAFSQQYGTIGVVTSDRKGDVTKGNRVFRDSYLDIAWVQPNQIDVPGAELGEIGPIAAQIAWKHKMDIAQAVETARKNATDLEEQIAKIDGLFTAKVSDYTQIAKNAEFRRTLVETVVSKALGLKA